jgi:hypothetical protein
MSRKAEWDVLNAGIELGRQCQNILRAEYDSYINTLHLSTGEGLAFLTWLLDGNDDGRDLDALYVDYQVIAAAAKDATWPIQT